jgi:hypothetical protein
VQSVFLLVAPALFAASIYMELGRIVESCDGDKHLFVRRRWMTSIFVFGDVISFLMQGSGGGLMGSKNTSSRTLGERIIVIGLFVQIVFFGFFVLTAALFHIRLNRSQAKGASPSSSPTRTANNPWRKHMIALYITSVLILVRSIFRVVEFLQGFDGYLMRYEIYLYIFDSVLMLGVMVVMNWFHPSQVAALIRGGWAIKGIKMIQL